MGVMLFGEVCAHGGDAVGTELNERGSVVWSINLEVGSSDEHDLHYTDAAQKGGERIVQVRWWACGSRFSIV